MFKFNFDIDNSNKQAGLNEDETPTKKLKTQENTDVIAWYDSKEIIPAGENLDLLNMYRLNAKEIQIGNIVLMYMIPKFVLDAKTDENVDIKIAEESHSDLIPGVYEGGAKLWECTLDLLDYFKDTPIEWNKKRVLDLGCGCGLLGTYALKQDAVVHFQDYNEDVLKNITIPNVLLNLDEDLLNEECFNELLQKIVHFYSGDWSKFVELTARDEGFDFILTSETIYNPENQQKLLEVFASKLKSNGKIYVAAKSYYFGVGGNLKQFEDLVKVDNRFKCKTIWTSSDGVKRQVLELELLKIS